MTYDHTHIAHLRDVEELSWAEIAGRLGQGTTAKQVRQAHHRWRKRNGEPETGEQAHGGQVIQKWVKTEEGTVHVRMPDAAVQEDVAEEVWADLRDDFMEWMPRKEPPPRRPPGRDDRECLAVLNLYDAHFGMKAWGEEVEGPSQDLKIISAEFEQAADHLVSMSRVYRVGRYLIPLGHDLSHVNQYGEQGKTATTRRGTIQDVDTRIAKIFRATRQSAVELIDRARATGRPVDVVMVPGNHDPDENFKLGEVLDAWYRDDPDENFKLGEVLDAWYRDDPDVSITNTPTMHKYYAHGRNSLMLTHGEHYQKRNAGNPILTFANECPIDIWAASADGGCREILSGHFHKRMQGRYIPTYDVDEESGVVTRSLPGLTARDAWHYQQGYNHRRAATLLVYKQEGGVLGLHEFSL